MTDIQQAIRQVLLSYEKQCQLGNQNQIISTQKASSEFTAEIRRLTIDSLWQIVLNEKAPTEYRLHLKDIAPAIGRNMQGVNFTENGFEVPVSASQTLVRIAASCGRLDELVDRTQDDRTQGDSIEAALIRIQIARQQGDPKQLAKRLTTFQQLITADIQRAAVPSKKSASTPTAKEESVQLGLEDQQSALKSKLVNQILHATWAISLSETDQAEGRRSEAQRIARKLLQQAAAVIESDKDTAKRLSRISRTIATQLKVNE